MLRCVAVFCYTETWGDRLYSEFPLPKTGTACSNGSEFLLTKLMCNDWTLINKEHSKEVLKFCDGGI